MIDYFGEMGIRYMWSNPFFPSVENTPVCQDITRRDTYYFDMDTYVDRYIEALKYAKAKGLFYGSFLTCNFDGESIYHCRVCTAVPHLTPDGYVSACDMGASVRKFAQSAFAENSVVHSDGYRSYIPALKDFSHEHKTYDSGSGLLHWLHIMTGNANIHLGYLSWPAKRQFTVLPRRILFPFQPSLLWPRAT